MRLTIEGMSYKNIMSVGAQPITLNFVNNKKILVTGKNGGGKSTMIEALCFGLFGKPFRSIKKGQLINTQNKKGLLVDITFNDGKNQFVVSRGIKPNIFSVTKNGEEIAEAASTKDFQTMFEEDIIRMNIQSFKQTIVLGTAGYTPFMELTAGNRRTLIEELINLSIFSEMDALNKTVVKDIKQQMDAIEIKLTGLRNEHSAHMQHIQKQQSMSDEVIAQLQTTYDNHISIAKTLKSEYDAIAIEIGEIVVGDDYNEQIRKCTKALSMVEAKMSGLIRNMEFFKNNTSCPTCKQEISTSHSDGIVSGMQSECDKLQQIKDQASRSETEYRDLQDVVDKTTREIARLKNDMQNKKTMMQREVMSAKQVDLSIQKAKTSAIIDTSRIDELDKEIETRRDEKTSMFEEMYARKIVLNMLKDSGIKAVVMKRYIPVINSKINQYLKLLGADYTFTLDQEFNEIIKSRGREDFSYMSFSQGEKARIDLSLMFTWRDVAAIVSGTEINLLVLDEVADGATDGEGVKAIHNILDNIKSNVIIISHREEHDKDKFTQHIRMVKKGRFTTME